MTTDPTTAQERLAAALYAWFESGGRIPENDEQMVEEYAWHAKGVLAADPTLAQVIEDGTALRLLREALPEGVSLTVESLLPDSPYAEQGHRWAVDVERDDDSDEVGPLFDEPFPGPTIAAAANQCRNMLEVTK